eukprot:401389_1
MSSYFRRTMIDDCIKQGYKVDYNNVPTLSSALLADNENDSNLIITNKIIKLCHDLGINKHKKKLNHNLMNLLVNTICNNRNNNSFIKRLLEVSIKNEINIMFMLEDILRLHQENNGNKKFRKYIENISNCLNHLLFEKASKIFKFVFRLSFQSTSRKMHQQQHATYHIAYINKRIEIRVTLVPRFDIMSNKLFDNTSKQKKILNARIFFESYLTNISQDNNIKHTNFQKTNAKNTLYCVRQNLNQIDKKWSEKFSYGYCMFYLRKNWEAVIVNCLFNEKKFFDETGLFTLKFKNRDKCDVCGKQKNKKFVKLKQCGKCRHAMYCGRKCQKYHWNKIHRLQCLKNLQWGKSSV